MDTQQVAVCVLPGASRLTAQLVASVLEAANEYLADGHYQVQVAPFASTDLSRPWDQFWLVAPWRSLADSAALAPLPAGLRELAERRVLLGGLEGGALWLAAAGLLEGRRACGADWLLPQLQQQQPGVVWTQDLWTLDVQPGRALLASSARPLSVPDLLLALLAREHGLPLARRLASRLGLAGLRAHDERLAEQPAAHALMPPRLAEALALMQANLAEPLPTDDVARLVGLSRRQLERLFKQHLDSLPSRHYLQLRLQRSRELLQRTGQSMLQVGLACGFASGAHFSNAYKAAFGCTPREERARELAGLRNLQPPGGATVPAPVLEPKPAGEADPTARRPTA
jgi:AraC family transcriptional regulator, L-arginine-responsive activator